MTDTTTIETDTTDPWVAALPADDDRSRIKPTSPASAGASDDDVVTTAQRLKKFRQKHPDGLIETTVEYDGRVEGYTATARVWRAKPGIDRYGAPVYMADAIAHATRTKHAADPITAAHPQEAAETAAIGRALRFLGIEPPKRRKPKAA